LGPTAPSNRLPGGVAVVCGASTVPRAGAWKGALDARGGMQYVKHGEDGEVEERVVTSESDKILTGAR